MFWTTQGWKADSVITVSPGANKLVLEKEYNVADDPHLMGIMIIHYLKQTVKNYCQSSLKYLEVMKIKLYLQQKIQQMVYLQLKFLSTKGTRMYY